MNALSRLFNAIACLFGLHSDEVKEFTAPYRTIFVKRCRRCHYTRQETWHLSAMTVDTVDLMPEDFDQCVEEPCVGNY